VSISAKGPMVCSSSFPLVQPVVRQWLGEA